MTKKGTWEAELDKAVKVNAKENKWKSREKMQPSKECFFHETKRCVGFHNCIDCDFHNLEPTKTAIVNRIKSELKVIKSNYKAMLKAKGRSVVDDSAYTDEKKLGLDSLDRFNGIQIMNGYLNEKFGFRVPDVQSFTVQKMLAKIRKNKDKYLKE